MNDTENEVPPGYWDRLMKLLRNARKLPEPEIDYDIDPLI